MKTPEQVLTEWVNDGIVFDWGCGSFSYTRNQFKHHLNLIKFSQPGPWTSISDVDYETAKSIWLEVAYVEAGVLELTHFLKFSSLAEVLAWLREEYQLQVIQGRAPRIPRTEPLSEHHAIE